MTELRKVQEEQQYFIRGRSLKEVGEAVDDFIAFPPEGGWRIHAVDVEAHIQGMSSMQDGIVATSVGFTATIHTVRTDVYGRNA